jgi:hypothetical protein
MEEGVAKNNMSLIDKTPSFSQKINLGTLKTSGARFLEVPKCRFMVDVWHVGFYSFA